MPALTAVAPESAQNPPPLKMAEFIALIASLMGMGAIGVDAMLPALPQIGHDLAVSDPNHPALVIIVFMVGLGLGQLIHGPLADRFGRKPVLLFALSGYAAMTAACAFTNSFTLLLAARLVAGLVISATRVVTVALVRDCFSGRAMGRVMSLSLMVFLTVPVLAPSLGQLVLLVGSWRAIFGIIVAAAVMVLAWVAWRLPETLAPENRRPASFGQVARAARITFGDRLSFGYTLAATALQGTLLAYITSAPQIVGEVFSAERIFGLVFGLTAGVMSVAALFNSRLVMRLGMRRISHSAVTVMIAVAALNLLIGELGYETLFTFTALQAVTLCCFGLATSNFSTLAMSNMGSIAGGASSLQGFVNMTLGSGIAWAISQSFDGTTQPFHIGVLLCAIVALVIAAVTERGKVFHSQEV